MIVSRRLYWTLWMLSCFGQYFGQYLQFPDPANGAVGESVVLAPVNPPSSSIHITQWSFTSTSTSTLIISVASGGTTVTPAYEGRVSFDNNTLALELQNLRLGDTGKYKLSLTLSAGDILTGETSLQVFEKISNVSLISPEESLIEGDSSANITSEGTGSVTSVEWMKDNSPLSPSNRIIFYSDNRSVSISPVQRSDSGEYQCTYRNPVSSETAKHSLIINYGPQDVSIEGPNEVNLGVRVSLSCSANSEPSASFIWRINETDTNVTTHTFTIEKTDFTHSGDYECTALNSVTNNSASQRHALLVKPGGGGGLTTGAIVGIVIGVLVAVAGICGLIVYLIKTKKIPMLNKGKSSGAAAAATAAAATATAAAATAAAATAAAATAAAAQSKQEPESNYEEIIDIQKIRRAVPVEMNDIYEDPGYEENEENEYENVNIKQ